MASAGGGGHAPPDALAAVSQTDLGWRCMGGRQKGPFQGAVSGPAPEGCAEWPRVSRTQCHS